MIYQRIPLWVKISYTLMVATILPVYWHHLGPGNFLWFSDIALIALVPALWLEQRLLASMMALSVLLLELSWLVDFLSGGNLTQIAAYMFTDDLVWYIRLLSGVFHLALPPVLLLLLYKLGYDRRALPAQALLCMVVVPLSYWLTGPEANVNWVYGPPGMDLTLPRPVYLALLITGFIVVVYLPSHWLFRRLFPLREKGKSTGRIPGQRS